MVQTSNKFAVWIAAGRILSMLAAFVMPLILTRYLSVADYGVFSQFYTLYTVLFALLAFGIHTNLFFFYPNKEKNLQSVYVSNTILILFSFSVLFCILFCIPPLQSLIFGDSALSQYKYLVIICITLAIPINIVSPLFSVREDKASALTFPALFAICRILLIVIIAIITNDIYKIMVGMVFYQIVVTSIVIIYSFRHHSLKIDIHVLKEQLLYSLPFGMAVSLQLLSNYFDKLVSINLLTPADYAVYSVAFLSIPGINQLYDALTQVNIINMSKCYNAKEYSRILPTYHNFLLKTFSFSAPIIIVVALYAEEIIGFLFPKEYIDAASYFRIYSLTFLIGMFGAGTILRSINKTKYSLYSFTISCLIGLPSAYFLIKMFGTWGAIVSAVINIVLPRILQMNFECRILKQTLSTYIPWKNIGMIFGYSLLCLVPLFALKLIFHLQLVYDIVLAIVYIAGTYYILLRNNIFIITSEQLVAFVSKFSKRLKK